MEEGKWYDVHSFPAKCVAVGTASYTLLVYLPDGVTQERTLQTVIYPGWPELPADKVPAEAAHESDEAAPKKKSHAKRD